MVRKIIYGAIMIQNENYYYKEISKIPLLSSDEEKELVMAASNGDAKARKRLIESNLRFVLKVARKYQNYGLDFDDLVTAGNIGLIKAADKFDASKQNKFITYAVWWIRDAIQKEIRNCAKGIRFPASKYEEMKDFKWNIASLDESIGNNDGSAVLGEFIDDARIVDPEVMFMRELMHSEMLEVMDGLKAKEKAVITMRYGLDGNEPMTLSAIGASLGYTKEGIRQIEKVAIKKLRKAFEEYEYLDACLEMAA